MSKHPKAKTLIGEDKRTLPALAAVNLVQFCAAANAQHLPLYVLAPLALTIGATLSLWQFALLHDVKHGNAALPQALSPDEVLFAASIPCVFGYFLYLRYGHLDHHRNLGNFSIREVFDSKRKNFEDGDVMFSSHRQSLPGDNSLIPEFFGKGAVGGMGISISRPLYALFWQDGWALNNCAIYSVGMLVERFALVLNDKLVALSGRNAFFPFKPVSFHRTCATYARVSAIFQMLMLTFCGPNSLLWLFFAEVGWQLPTHPASAFFVSNHPSLDSPKGDCQPTSSVYWGGAIYDWLCCFSNYHIEHHDFPDVPAFRLRELRDIAAGFYSDDVISGARDGWLATMKRTFSGRAFYACAGAGVGLQNAPLSEGGVGEDGATP